MKEWDSALEDLLLCGDGSKGGTTGRPHLWRAAMLTALLLISGCAFGPRAIERTHGLYAAAVQQVEEEQFLRNIVRLRYLEGPTSLEVAAIAAQYELSASAEARPFFGTESAGSPPIFRQFSAILPFASVGGSNRPTVSLAPQDDGTTVRQMLTPISMETLVFLGQSGWAVSSILRLWANRLNGVPNLGASFNPPRDLEPDFERFRHVCDLLQRIQDQELMSLHTEDRHVEVSGPLPANVMTASASVEAAKSGFEYHPTSDGKSWVLIRRERRLVLHVNPSGLERPELTELAQALNLKANLTHYDFVVATGVPDPLKNPSEPGNEFRLTPRSIWEVYFYLANGVEVPPAHLVSGIGCTSPGKDTTEVTRGLFHVHVCKGYKRPAYAYIAIRHRDHWFYIDDRDHESKATVLLMMQLRRLDFQRQKIGVTPALTLPVGR